MNARNFGLAAGVGGIGAGLMGMGGGHNNPADAAMGSLNEMPSQIQQYYQPYMQAGQQALGGVQNQYNNLMNDPGAKLNNIGQGFHQSPGYNFALQQALQSTNHGAAAGGMFGSPQHQQQNMQVATGLADQDYYNWLGQATGMFGEGIHGLQGIAGMGQQASMGYGDQMAQLQAQKANLQYAGAENKNQSQAGDFGNIMSGLGTLAAFY